MVPDFRGWPDVIEHMGVAYRLATGRLNTAVYAEAFVYQAVGG
jgi:hypothetical protein